MVLAALLAVLTGCQQAWRPPALVTPGQEVTASHEATILRGRVVEGYGTQATAAQLLSYATVTLMDASHQVVATGLTDASGAFGLNPFVAWAPTTNAVYVLDALKTFDRTSDRAGLRFRTLVSWNGSQWRSLSGSTASPAGGPGVLVSAQTTALAAIQSLRARSASALLGTLNPASGAFTPTDGVTSSEVETVTALVHQALAANLDPVAYLSYSNGSYALRLSGSSPGVLFDLEDAIGQSLNNRTPVKGHDGGAAYAFSNGIALPLSQFGASGSVGGLMAEPMGLDTDRYGNIYVADFNNNRIQKFSAEGRFLTSLGTLGSGSVQFDRPTDVRVDSLGNLLVSDYMNCRVQKLDPFGNLIFGLGGGGRWTGAAPTWSTIRNSGHGFFHQAHYTKFDAAGNIWVSDFLHQRMLKFDPNGNFLLGFGGGTRWTTPYQPNSLKSPLAGNYIGTVTWGAAVQRFADGCATDGTFIYVHDGNPTNGGFYKITREGAVVAGPGATPYFNSQQGAMAYVNGRLYYRGSGTGANKIVVINTTTMNETGYLLQNGLGSITSANNDAHPWGTSVNWNVYSLTTDGRYLYIPADSTTGATFTVSVYDPYNNMAWVRDVVCPVPAGLMNFDHHAIYANGDYLFVMQERTTGGWIYKFRLADGAYLGRDETIYDPNNDNPTPSCFDYVNKQIIVHYHALGRFAVYASDSKGTGNGYFSNQTGFTVLPTGEIYVCDRDNHRIQKFDVDGNYVTQWGTDGTGPGQFKRPEDVIHDQAGNLWVTEYGGDRIQLFDRSGETRGQFGSTGSGPGQFRIPRGIAQAPDGTLLIGEWDNNRVTRLLPTLTRLTTHATGHFNAARGTIAFWFKPTWNGTDVNNRVFFRQAGTTTNNFGLHKNGSQFYLYVTDNVGDAARAVRIGLSSADTVRLIRANEWYHLAVTWDTTARQYRFFLNGTEYASFATNTALALNLGPSGMLHIGTDSDSTGPCDSVLDDFRIFDYPKSAEEILRDYRGLVQE